MQPTSSTRRSAHSLPPLEEEGRGEGGGPQADALWKVRTPSRVPDGPESPPHLSYRTPLSPPSGERGGAAASGDAPLKRHLLNGIAR
jgi:hypothetical protein